MSGHGSRYFIDGISISEFARKIGKSQSATYMRWARRGYPSTSEEFSKPSPRKHTHASYRLSYSRAGSLADNDGMSTDEIAATLGISAVRVNQIIREALDKLAVEIARRGWRREDFFYKSRATREAKTRRIDG